MTRTKTAIGIVLLVLVAVSVIFWHGRLSADFYPPDRSFVGPNLVAAIVQGIVVFVAAVLLYPPFRRAMEQIAHKANADLHEKLKASHDELHAKLDANKEALHHIIRHHPDIPNLPGMEPVRKPKKASTK